jgi:hypothetical protein
MSTATVRAEPRLAFTALCEYLQATPTRRRSLLEQQKYPTGPRVRNYNAARQRIVRFATDGVSLDADGLEPHEQEVVQCLVQHGWTVPASTCCRPDADQPAMVICGVRVSAFPDLLLRGTPRYGASAGALKFFFPREPRLSQQVGQWMASVLHYYLANVLNNGNAHHGLCIVHDVRGNVSHHATGSHARLFRNVEHACREVALLWPAV